VAEATTTNNFRQRLARHFYDGSALPQVAMMAFGDGGHNADGTAKQPDPGRTSLYHEVLRKPLAQKVQEDAYSVTGTGRIEKSEVIGAHISEAALLDENGNMLSFRNFAPKIKESDETYEIKVKLKF